MGIISPWKHIKLINLLPIYPQRNIYTQKHWANYCWWKDKLPSLPSLHVFTASTDRYLSIVSAVSEDSKLLLMNVNYQNRLLRCRLTSSTSTHVLQPGSSLLVFLTFKSLQIFQEKALEYFTVLRCGTVFSSKVIGYKMYPNHSNIHENPINLFSKIGAN